MVQGLGFLSKKSWHTKNIKNQEEVWLAEQRKKAEADRAKELAREIQQEREREELDRIAGKSGAKVDKGIDWMYSGQQKNSEIARQDAEKKAEEYLLGKEFVGGPVKGDLDEGEANEGINKVLTSTVPHVDKEEEDAKPVAVQQYQEPSVFERNEAFRKRFEDPMFMVSQQSRERERAIEKKKELYEKVTGGVAVPAEKGRSREDAKKKKHKRKKDKKRKKEKRRRRSYSDDDSRSSYESDDSRDRRERKRKRRDDYDSDSSSRERSRRRRSRSRSRSYDRGEGSGRYNSRYESEDRRYRRESDGDRHYTERQRYNERDHYEQSSRRPDDDRRAGYGLQGGSSNHSQRRPPDDLGPDQEALRRKREEREAERQRAREMASRRRPKSAEDRAKALREMEADARRRDGERDHRRRDTEEDMNHSSKRRANFLHDLAQKTHGVREDGTSMSERLSQNRNKNQRGHESFM